ncbi:hypothetical protein RSAG8_00080, partial [Rhizoctonia solani AG-8 WAC10335]
MFRATRLVLFARPTTRSSLVLSRHLHSTRRALGSVSDFIPKPVEEQRASVTPKRFWKKVDVAENNEPTSGQVSSPSFHESHPPALVKLQEEHWNPLLKWAESTYNIKINIFDSVLGNTQPKETKEVLMNEVNKLGQWEMAAFERAVLTTKSFIIALALVKGRINVEQAAQAAHVEVVSQTQRWGEVEDTHDVDYHDIRRQMGSVACVLATN